MHRNPGSIAIIASGLLVFLGTACRKPVDVLGRQGPPDGVSGVKVAKRCRQMSFDPQAGSGVLDIKGDGSVLLTMYPAVQSIKWRLKDLASRKGRIVARVVNTGSGEFQPMAIAPGDTACWHVWMDDEDVVHAQWVGLNNDANPDVEPLVQPDKYFEIKFHDAKHPKDESRWNPPETTALAEPREIFQLASYTPQFLLTGNTGWTTCLVNGCCRSRQ